MDKKNITSDKKKMCVVRVRGSVHVRSDIKDTLKMLKLSKVNHCVIVDNRPQYQGMINKVKDYVTWGEINEETMLKLLSIKAEVVGRKPLDDAYLKKNTKNKDLKSFTESLMNFKADLKDVPALKPVFRLKPPTKGYDRGGIKQPYSRGGALGYRGEKINELVERML